MIESTSSAVSRVRVAVAVDFDAAADPGSPVDAELFDVLQADVVDQRGDAHLRPRAVDLSRTFSTIARFSG